MELIFSILSLLIFSGFDVTFAQTPVLTCNYTIISQKYTCVLTIQNPNGLNNILTICGVHLPGKTDLDVLSVIKQPPCNTAIIPSILCNKFKNLQDLDLIACGIKKVDELALKGCTKLSYMMLVSNAITEVHEKAFFNNLEFKHLSLAYNQLTTLPENVFINQRKLEGLFLVGNKISDLPNNIFKSLTSVTMLTLGSNQIKTLRPEWFIGLDNLPYLHLITNLIEELPKNIFAPLKNLGFLGLSGNSLKVINSDAFSFHPKLNMMFLKDNQISAVDRRLLNVTGLTQVDMRNNVCANKIITDETVTKDIMRADLKNCFDNFKPPICRKCFGLIDEIQLNFEILFIFFQYVLIMHSS